MSVPVLVLDLSEEEADKLLVTLDPMAGLAGTDLEKLTDLLGDSETDSAGRRELYAGLVGQRERWLSAHRIAIERQQPGRPK